MKPKIVQSVAAVAAVLAAATISMGQALSQQTIDPEAERILKSMSAYLGGLASFSVKFDADTEVVLRSAEKIQLSSSGDLVVQRPGNLRATRHGMFTDAEIFFDGKTISIHNKTKNAYGRMESPGTIDDALDMAREQIGIDAPGADILYSDAYSGLLIDVESGAHVGTTMVGGMETDHLAFRAKDVDWQIWIQTGDKPLPLKYVITSKWMAGAPEYQLRLHEWNMDPKIEPATFSFSPPQGAKEFEAVTANELGEMSDEVQQ
jgi:hypothetical protein